MNIVHKSALAGAAVLLIGIAGCDTNKAAPEQTSSKTSTPNPSIEKKPPAPPTAAQNPTPTSTAGAGVANVDSTHGRTDFSKMAALNDDQIAAVVVALNQGEIDQADVALKEAKADEVKHFAHHMKDDHTKWLTDAKDLAKKQKLDPKEGDISKMLKDDSDSTMKMLSTTKGDDFDKEYVDAQVKGHQMALDLIDERLSKDVKNDDLKKAIDDVKPKIATHLAEAKTLQNDLAKGGSVGAKTERQTEEPTTAPKK